MTTIQAAVIGGGRWGTHWIRNLLTHPAFNLVAIADASSARRQHLTRQFCLTESVQQFATGTDLLKTCASLDAVVVATPAITHTPLIRQALQRGCHVLAEKPLTLEPAEARSLCEQAAQLNRILLVDHTYLFNAAVLAGRGWLQSQSLASLRYAYATRTHLGPIRQDVDALWDLAIHDIAILNYWLGEQPIRGQALGQVWLQCDRSDDPRFPQGLSDQVNVRLLYPSGAQAMLHFCWANPDKQRRLGLVSDRGTLVFDEMQPEYPLRFYPGDVNPQACGFTPTVGSPQDIPFTVTEPLRNVCDHFVSCINQQQESRISSGWLGLELVQVLTKLTQSLNAGGAWVNFNDA